MRPHRRQPTRLPRPWDSLGKNTGVGCHFLLQRMKVKSESEVAQSCPTLSDPMDCSLTGSSVHGIFQARVLEWGAKSCISAVKSSVLSTGCGQKRQQSACLQGACTAAGRRQTIFWKTQNVKYAWEWWVSHDLQIPLYPHVLWVAPHLHLCLVGNAAWPENLWGYLTESILLQRAILCLPCTLIQPFNCLPSPLTSLLFLMSLYFVIHWRCHT